MASIKNLLIRLGVTTDDVDRPIERTNAALRRVADQADRTDRSLTSCSGSFTRLRGVADALTPRLGAAGSALGAVTTGLGRAGAATGALVTGLVRVTGALGGVTAGLGKLALGGAALAGLAAAAGGATAATLGLTAALAPVTGLLAAMPGMALAGGAAFLSLKLAVGGLGEAMSAALSGSEKALGDALSKLSDAGRAFIIEFTKIIPLLRSFQNAAQEAFLGHVVGRMEEWLMALADLKPQLAAIADEFGRMVASVMDFVTSPPVLLGLRMSLEETLTVVRAIGDALPTLTDGFLSLAGVGTGWLASMSGGLTNALVKFGEWMGMIVRTGKAFEWMNSAAQVVKQLAMLLVDLVGIIVGVLQAVETAGGGALGVLGRLVDGMHAWVDSAQGQAILVEIFRALGAMGQSLIPVVQALLAGVAQLAPVLGDLAMLVGPVLTAAIQALAPALANLGGGIAAVITALGQAVNELAPTLPLLGTWLGEIISSGAPLIPILARIAEIIAGTLVNALWSVVPAFVTVGEAVVTALDLLSGPVSVALDSLALALLHVMVHLPGLAWLLGEVLTAAAPLIPALVDIGAALAHVLLRGLLAVAPAVVAFVQALVPAVQALQGGAIELFTALGQAIMSLAQSGALQQLGAGLAGLLSALAPLAPLLAQVAAQIISALAPALPAVGAAIAGVVQALTPLLPLLAGLIAHVIQLIGPVLPPLVSALVSVVSAFAPLVPVVAQVAQIVGQVLTSALQILLASLTPVINALVSSLQPVLPVLAAALQRVLEAVAPLAVQIGQGLAKALADVLPPLLALLPKLIEGLLPVVLNLIDAFIKLLPAFWPLIPAFLELLNAIVPLVPLVIQLSLLWLQMAPLFVPIIEWVLRLATAFMRDLIPGLQLVLKVVDSVINGVVGIFRWLYDVLIGNSIIPDLINGIKEWFQKGVDWVKGIVQWFGELPGMISRWMGDVADWVRRKWDEIREAVADRIGRIRDAISEGLGRIQDAWNRAWSEVSGWLSSKWGEITNAVGQGIGGIVNWFSGLPGRILSAVGNLAGLLFNAGHDVMVGFWNGLVSMWNWVVSNVQNLFGSLAGWAKSVLGIASPSKVFMAIGRELPAGLALGMDRAMGLVEAAAGRMADAASFDVGGVALAGAGVPGVSAVAASASRGGVTVEHLSLTVNGADLDFRNLSGAARRLAVEIRRALRDLDREQL